MKVFRNLNFILLLANYSEIRSLHFKKGDITYFRYENIIKILDLSNLNDKEKNLVYNDTKGTFLGKFEEFYYSKTNYSSEDNKYLDSIDMIIVKWLKNNIQSIDDFDQIDIFDLKKEIPLNQNIDFCIVFQNTILSISLNSAKYIDNFDSKMHITLETNQGPIRYASEKNQDGFGYHHPIKGNLLMAIPLYYNNAKMIILDPKDIQFKYPDKICEDQCLFSNCSQLNVEFLSKEFGECKPLCCKFQEKIRLENERLNEFMITEFLKVDLSNDLDPLQINEKIKFEAKKHIDYLQKGFNFYMGFSQYFENLLDNVSKIISDNINITHSKDSAHLSEVCKYFIGKTYFSFFLFLCKLASKKFTNLYIINTIKLPKQIVNFFDKKKTLNILIDILNQNVDENNAEILNYVCYKMLFDYNEIFFNQNPRIHIFKEYSIKLSETEIELKEYDKFRNLLKNKYYDTIKLALSTVLKHIHLLNKKFKKIVNIQFSEFYEPLFLINNGFLTEIKLNKSQKNKLSFVNLPIIAKEHYNSIVLIIYYPLKNKNQRSYFKIFINHDRNQSHKNLIEFGYEFYLFKNKGTELNRSFIVENQQVNQ